MKITRLAAALLLSASAFSVANQASAAEWADLRIQFVYDAAKAPERKTIDVSKDELCVKERAGDPALSDELIVNPESMGIANVVIYPDRRSGIEESDVHPDVKNSEEPAILDNVDCKFAPHVVVMTPGKLIIKNSDIASHNAAVGTFNNDAINPVVPAGGSVEVEFKKAERGPAPVSCGIHPWMKAFVLIQELPYMGVSDEDGVITIAKLPAGKEISLKLWHESTKTLDSVMIGGKEVKLKKGVLTLTLKPGLNDMGVAKLKPSQFE